MRETIPDFVLEWVSDTRCPDRTLRAAVLDRAVRDLKEERLIRKEAIKWFRSKHRKDRGKLSFTYLEIKEDLDLGSWEINYIEKLVLEAEKVWEPDFSTPVPRLHLNFRRVA